MCGTCGLGVLEEMVGSLYKGGVGCPQCGRHDCLALCSGRDRKDDGYPPRWVCKGCGWVEDIYTKGDEKHEIAERPDAAGTQGAAPEDTGGQSGQGAEHQD